MMHTRGCSRRAERESERDAHANGGVEAHWIMKLEEKAGEVKEKGKETERQCGSVHKRTAEGSTQIRSSVASLFASTVSPAQSL